MSQGVKVETTSFEDMTKATIQNLKELDMDNEEIAMILNKHDRSDEIKHVNIAKQVKRLELNYLAHEFKEMLNNPENKRHGDLWILDDALESYEVVSRKIIEEFVDEVDF